jgi:methionyl-tRNA synthetase
MPAGTVLHQGEALFPRLAKKKQQRPRAQTQENEQGKKGKVKQKEAASDITEGCLEGMITFEQFGEVELRVAEIVTAEKIKKANKLLKLTVKSPEERTLVAGIAKHYSPEELIGRKVIIVANLKPAQLMGITSQGMVLAAKETDEDGNERLVLSTVAGDIAPGSRVA